MVQDVRERFGSEVLPFGADGQWGLYNGVAKLGRGMVLLGHIVASYLLLSAFTVAFCSWHRAYFAL